MPVQLNHTIVAARDRRQSASFLADVLGVAPPTMFGPFAVVELANDVSLDFADDEHVHPRHYAFLVTEQEFDEIFGRIRARGLDFADDEHVHPRHYVFLVTEQEFDEIFGRIRARGLDFWADPFQHHPGEINTNDGGRGVYWLDPDGHLLEIITRPYGG